jgi:hypothetical protein
MDEIQGDVFEHGEMGGAALVRARVWSSLKDTSMDQCKQSSMDRWEWTAWAMRCASGAKLLIYRLCSQIVLPPIVRSDLNTSKQCSPFHCLGLSRHSS